MDYLYLSIVILIIATTIWLWRKYAGNSNRKTPTTDFPNKWKSILERKVAFYNALNAEEKIAFEYRVQEFLLNHRITGIDVNIDDTDRLLVASSAIIPIFGFPNWRYSNLFEVLLYPSNFNFQFETAGPGRFIQGMVGTGLMEGKMILSKPALRKGFENETDKHNVAIHEFVHLIDKLDGNIDGFPKALMDKQYAIPWMSMVVDKMEEVQEGVTKINEYGATSEVEFFAVMSEYFFERPKLLEKNHPELYKIMEQVFNQDMASRDLNTKKQDIGRNDPCPCSSGKKFKKCCGRVHYS